MKKTYLLIFISFLFFTKVNSQNKNLPKNAKPGKCYVRCFDYETKVEWEEIDCSLVKKSMKKFKKTEEYVREFKNYQRKLIDLGYKLTVTGLPDDSTVNAHNKYLSKKRKEERRKKKMEKKRLKKQKKMKNKITK